MVARCREHAVAVKEVGFTLSLSFMDGLGLRRIGRLFDSASLASVCTSSGTEAFLSPSCGEIKIRLRRALQTMCIDDPAKGDPLPFAMNDHKIESKGGTPRRWIMV